MNNEINEIFTFKSKFYPDTLIKISYFNETRFNMSNTHDTSYKNTKLLKN